MKRLAPTEQDLNKPLPPYLIFFLCVAWVVWTEFPSQFLTVLTDNFLIDRGFGMGPFVRAGASKAAHPTEVSRETAAERRAAGGATETVRRRL